MKTEQRKFSTEAGWQTLNSGKSAASEYNLVLAFGCRQLLADPAIYESIRAEYPHADIVMNSTAGEIYDTEVNDQTVSLTAIHFEKTRIKTTVTEITDEKDSFNSGQRLASGLEHAELKSVLVISDGHQVNGSDLVSGLQEFLPKNTLLTGGMAGDGSRFESTIVGLNNPPTEGKIVLVGFYGDQLSVTYGSVGGWDSFGVDRLITRADQNVLYELDDKPALDIYKLYLGDYAKELPGSALLFPLSIRTPDSEHAIVRTILSVNEEEKSLTFAGNMPHGSYARLMKANTDRLIEGASTAARNSVMHNKQSPDLAILISCVGRKLVLNQRVEEEVEVIRTIYGNETTITGFYSYGEISPSIDFLKCELHNQTMTITTLTEE